MKPLPVYCSKRKLNEKEKTMSLITMTIRCPHCKNKVELDEDGRKKCCCCDYEIDINRFN
jgi:hypothetical protein